ncbi:hypothetical protein OsccyDRAFT_0652 [Leptolyngbyaceae cyanobacterium JSC-12]|nr:hypothetical protein OsccyDRAFT_0652 [Leptolyngbyaceae cyanobacterium JSC-12]
MTVLERYRTRIIREPEMCDGEPTGKLVCQRQILLDNEWLDIGVIWLEES